MREGVQKEKNDENSCLNSIIADIHSGTKFEFSWTSMIKLTYQEFSWTSMIKLTYQFG
jgi:hypothetical protein